MFYRCSILIFVAVITGFVSCKNNDEVIARVVLTNLNVVNASADTLNFYLNGTRQNNSTSLYPGSQTFYIPVPGGAQTYQFKKAGSFAALFSLPIKLKDTTYNSLYVAGTSADKSFITIDSLFIDTARNSTQIKFINASPDAGNLDVYVGDTINYKSRAFKSASVFLPTGAGLKVVKIYQTGSATPIIDTPMRFSPGSIYTLFSRGQVNGRGNAAFKVGIVLNH